MGAKMKSKNRRYDIDWLRVMAFYILIFFHVGMIFVPWDFHIKNSETVQWIEGIMTWSNQWRLPLLFMISGTVIFYSLGKRSGNLFVLDRIKRLLIPLLFGMLFIIPPQIYVERLFNGFEYQHYWEFWKTVFNFKPYPSGNFSWHHLWYVVYILVYSLIALPFFKYLRNDRSKPLNNSISKLIKRYPGIIYLISIPLYIFYLLLAENFPTTNDLINDWYKHSIYFTLFLYGYVISATDGLWDALVRMKKVSLIFGFSSGMILMLFVWGSNFEYLYEKYSWFIYIYGVFKWIAILFWLLAIFGYGKALLNKPSKFLNYANETVYPLYILHQTVELVFAYQIIKFDWPVLPKFILLVIVTFGVSLLLYELIIKRYNSTRLLFGMKSKPFPTRTNFTLQSRYKKQNSDIILLREKINSTGNTNFLRGNHE
jgi:hypothetical protein